MTVSEQIIQVLNALCEKFGVAIDWTSEHIIPHITTLCGKLVAYEIGTSIAWIVSMAMLSIGSILATKKLYPTFKKGVEANKKSYADCGWEVGSVFAIIALVVLNLTSVIVIGVQIMDIVKCAIFPELYVFEYIQGLL